ncbi:putative aldehyde dehydrogenase [Gordonia rhizosphera NBRC 16068]|uniref:Putative aldehyde dehydrogenase n=1 Tax=Gordonia rhizosphera NBRC 16068 TaxID=1108045 RepID=K6WBY5_9ACTN|nr:putative aldehyde dehydrogenase [Gordonia rhizosphera NBRC 16068]
MFVGGAWWRASGAIHTVVSPATEQPIAATRHPSIADTLAAVEAADNARDVWAAAPVSERVAACARWLDAVDARAADLDVLWAVEAGMPVRHGRALYRFAAVPAWQSALAGAEEILADQRRSSELGAVLLRRESVGVVVAILPYNGPVVTVASKVIPALLAGCPVVIKAAPESQLTMTIVAECARLAGFPPGVVSVVCGGVDVGQTLTRDPRVDMVSLTGGHVAAQDVLAATRERYARVQLELGGKSPAIILDDAPLDTAMRSLIPGATNAAGQVCALLSRILVSRRRHDEVIERLRVGFERLRIGDPLDPATHIGPLVNAAAVRRTEGVVAQALADGAELITGGTRPEGLDVGHYYRPTLFTGIPEDAQLIRREVFGPATAVQVYDDVADAVRLANATEFGLSGAVFTANTDNGIEIATRIRAGSVAVNAFGPTMSAPFGGVKASGWGREAGPEGILGFTELKQILIGQTPNGTA